MTETDDLCACENISQSEFSPGIVEDNESLARSVLSPLHVDNTGSIKPDAFEMKDLRERGVSVDRLLHANVDAINEHGEEWAARQEGREFAGVVVAIAQDIRAIEDSENIRAFCIKDSAREDNIAHADFVSAMARGKALLRGLRGDLVDIFGKVQKL